VAGHTTRRLLQRVIRRHAVITSAFTFAIGLLLASVVVAATGASSRTAAGIVVMLGILSVAVTGLRARRASAATLLERRAPECRNLLITAEELLRADAPRGSVREAVLRRADIAAASLDVPTLLPLARPIVLAVAAGLVYATAVRLPADGSAIDGYAGGTATEPHIRSVDVIVTPPRYLDLKADTLRDPARIEVRAGSSVRLLVEAQADSVFVETIDGALPLAREIGGFDGSVTADGDGFLAIRAKAGQAATVARRLIALVVAPDELPRVRITAPARDLFVATPPQTLEITLEADDDFGLGTLDLRYTRVSGSGEQFEFTDGVVPLRIERASAASWRARGVLPVEALELGAGDMIVYRGVATDRRPGARPVESDAYILEVTGPGAIAAGGFAADDEQDRYAISQQMLIVETERLNARRASLAAGTLRDQAMRLASLQRQVRAEFVFMLGGELEDDVGEETGVLELNEHAEAEAEDDILAGRLANRGRVELLRAIREMSRASSALNEADLSLALRHERDALAYLQRAFSRTRYILRTLTERERLDLSRRLTGNLADAGRAVRPTPTPERDARADTLRAILAGIAEQAARASNDARETAALAERLLRIAGSDEALQSAAAQLMAVSDAQVRGDAAETRDALHDTALRIAGTMRSMLPAAAADATTLESRVLEGALVDALRRRVPR